MGSMFSDTCGNGSRGLIIAKYHGITMEPPPMWIREFDEDTRLNWVAILSFGASLLFSITIWIGIIRAVERLVG